MNILFIQGGSRLKQAEDGRWFTDPNFTEEIWRRYLSLGDSLTILLKREKKIYSREYAERHFNPVITGSNVKVVPMPDAMKPRYNYINPIVRRTIRAIVEKEILKADRVIIRSYSIYCEAAHDVCKKLGKDYLFEATGFAKEGLSNHSFWGRLLADKYEKKYAMMARDAKAAIYVTDEALQKRYPCLGPMLGCSDVNIGSTSDDVIQNRINKINKRKVNDVIKIGTAAFLDVKWKGQHNVIQAIAELKRRGIANIRYELIGAGTGTKLKTLANKLGVSDQIIFLGAKPHSVVFGWLDDLDIYIQPSYQEGLCRAIAEAISRACPVIASNTGGNYELINNDYIFECGDYHRLADLIIKISKDFTNEALQNYEHSKHYSAERLDSMRNEFMQKFIRESN